MLKVDEDTWVGKDLWAGKPEVYRKTRPGRNWKRVEMIKDRTGYPFKKKRHRLKKINQSNAAATNLSVSVCIKFVVPAAHVVHRGAVNICYLTTLILLCSPNEQCFLTGLVYQNNCVCLSHIVPEAEWRWLEHLLHLHRGPSGPFNMKIWTRINLWNVLHWCNLQPPHQVWLISIR